MRTLDRILQAWRIRKALQEIPDGATILDIGTFDGRIFTEQPAKQLSGVGIDPALAVAPGSRERFRLIQGMFPDALPADERFDTATALAVMEHIPAREIPAFLARLLESLKPGGQFVITVPSPMVDRLLPVLQSLRLIHGQSLEQHYGLEVGALKAMISAAGFHIVAHRRFQLGLNNLIVCIKR